MAARRSNSEMKHADPSRQQKSLAGRNGRPGEAFVAEEKHNPGSRLIVVPSPQSQPGSEKIVIPIGGDPDIVKARQEGRRIAATVGFSMTDLVLVATAISELARNIIRYARKGEVVIQSIANSSHSGIEIIARDEGPGIKDVEEVLRVGFSTSGGLGLGLPGVRRLMDEFEIESKLGLGTTVVTKKWRN